MCQVILYPFFFLFFRPVAKLPVHIDVPRLCKKIVVSVAEETHFDGKKTKYNDKPNQDVTKTLLMTVATLLNDDDCITCLKNNFDEHLSGGGDVGTKLASWFTETIETLGKEPPTLLLFKTVHQQCIFPAFYCMRNLIEPSIGKFKDKRGSWQVDIDIRSTDVAMYVSFHFQINRFSVHHTKRQQSQEVATDGTPDFEFDWILTIPLIDGLQQVDRNKIEITLKDLQCGNHVSADGSATIANSIKNNAHIT
eukprot:TRINITY_DN3934_c0_g2_i5.p1 TRINITY_DN3934_c0_g2~~TRINITY_DN3934_c0_g2_i5.p1  ORF type:complete len:251 (-),score=37.59 TRINITY_DN3934_c0_g2_i5:108-860(-)